MGREDLRKVGGMTIAVDPDEMGELRAQLGDAAVTIGGAVPTLPGAAAYGPAVLAAAVAAFDDAVRRDARQLHDRWAALDVAVGETLDDMDALESTFVADIRRTGAPLA